MSEREGERGRERGRERKREREREREQVERERVDLSLALSLSLWINGELLDDHRPKRGEYWAKQGVIGRPSPEEGELLNEQNGAVKG